MYESYVLCDWILKRWWLLLYLFLFNAKALVAIMIPFIFQITWGTSSQLV
jgi:hypothetical protein